MRRARYLAALRRPRLGEQNESTINGTRCVVVGNIEAVLDCVPRWRFTAEKVGHGWREGWAQIGGRYPESTASARRIAPLA